VSVTPLDGRRSCTRQTSLELQFVSGAADAALVALLHHRLAVAIVGIGVFATVGVFTFARPQYRAAGSGGKVLHFAEATPPSRGWTWNDPTPGFHFGEHHNDWNISLLKPREVPTEVGVLAASRIDQVTRPEVIYSKGNCIGVQPSSSPRRVLCAPHTPAVIIAQAPRPIPNQEPPGYNMFITGVVRSDVTRVTVRTRKSTFVDMRSGKRIVRQFPPQVVYDSKTPSWWGSFQASTFQPVRWDALVVVYGKHGKLASLRIRFTKPGETLYCASAIGTSCTTRSAK
jgi:hypothetical protein